MREAVIVSTARTPIGKAYRGAFNDLEAPNMVGQVIAEAVSRAGIDAADVDDCVIGSAVQQGTTGYNIGRLGGLSGGLPASVAALEVGEVVAQPDVGERAARHDAVVAAARAVAVEVVLRDGVAAQVLTGRAVELDRAGGGDVVGGHRVAEQRQDHHHHQQQRRQEPIV